MSDEKVQVEISAIDRASQVFKTFTKESQETMQVFGATAEQTAKAVKISNAAIASAFSEMGRAVVDTSKGLAVAIGAIAEAPLTVARGIHEATAAGKDFADMASTLMKTTALTYAGYKIGIPVIEAGALAYRGLSTGAMLAKDATDLLVGATKLGLEAAFTPLGGALIVASAGYKTYSSVLDSVAQSQAAVNLQIAQTDYKLAAQQYLQLAMDIETFRIRETLGFSDFSRGVQEGAESVYDSMGRVMAGVADWLGAQLPGDLGRALQTWRNYYREIDAAAKESLFSQVSQTQVALLRQEAIVSAAMQGVQSAMKYRGLAQTWPEREEATATLGAALAGKVEAERGRLQIIIEQLNKDIANPQKIAEAEINRQKLFNTIALRRQLPATLGENTESLDREDAQFRQALLEKRLKLETQLAQLRAATAVAEAAAQPAGLARIEAEASAAALAIDAKRLEQKNQIAIDVAKNFLTEQGASLRLVEVNKTAEAQKVKIRADADEKIWQLDLKVGQERIKAFEAEEEAAYKQSQQQIALTQAVTLAQAGELDKRLLEVDQWEHENLLAINAVYGEDVRSQQEITLVYAEAARRRVQITAEMTKKIQDQLRYSVDSFEEAYRLQGEKVSVTQAGILESYKPYFDQIKSMYSADATAYIAELDQKEQGLRQQLLRGEISEQAYYTVLGELWAKSQDQWDILLQARLAAAGIEVDQNLRREAGYYNKVEQIRQTNLTNLSTVLANQAAQQDSVWLAMQAGATATDAKLGTFWANVSRGFEDTFTNIDRSLSDTFFYSMQMQFDKLGDVVSNFGKMMLRTFAKILADETTRRLVNFVRGLDVPSGSGLLGGLGGLLGGLGSWAWGGLSSIGSSIGSFLGFLQTGLWDVPDLAGQEWAVLHPGEMVLPPAIAAAVRAQGGLPGFSQGSAGTYTGPSTGWTYEGGGGAMGPSAGGPESPGEAIANAIGANLSPGQRAAFAGMQVANVAIGFARSAIAPKSIVASYMTTAMVAEMINSWGLQKMGLDPEEAADLAGSLRGFASSLEGINALSKVAEAFGTDLPGLVGIMAADRMDQAARNASWGGFLAGLTGPGWDNDPNQGAPPGVVGGGWDSGTSGEGFGGGTRGSSDIGSDAAGQGGAWATGGVFDVGRRTRITVGDAGREKVAVIRNPREVDATGGGSPITVNIAIDLRGALNADPRALTELVRERIVPEIAKLERLRHGPWWNT